MKITKRENPEARWVGIKEHCWACNSEFILESGDLVGVFETFYSMDCPVCTLHLTRTWSKAENKKVA